MIASFIKGIIQYRGLVWEMAKRDLRNRYAGSYLGVFWTIIVPLLSSVVYIIVFSMLIQGGLRGRYVNINFAVYYFTGFTPWLLFTETLSRNLNIVKANSSLVTKLSFPNQILPFSTFLSSLVAHLVLLLLTIGLIFYYGIPFSHRPYMLVPYFILLFVITMGLSLFFSALCVFISDLAEIIPILLNLAFFCTPILYTPESVTQFAPAWARPLFLTMNPFHYIVEGYRMSLFNIEAPLNVRGLLILAVYGLAFSLVGGYTFRRLKKSFADVL
jgi:lipopolysaccharide transport system permease protein